MNVCELRKGVRRTAYSVCSKKSQKQVWCREGKKQEKTDGGWWGEKVVVVGGIDLKG